MDADVEYDYDEAMYGDDSESPPMTGAANGEEWAQLMHPYMAGQQMAQNSAAAPQHMMQGQTVSKQQMMHHMLPVSQGHHLTAPQNASSPQDVAAAAMYNMSPGSYPGYTHHTQQQYHSDATGYNMVAAGHYYGVDPLKQVHTKTSSTPAAAASNHATSGELHTPNASSNVSFNYDGAAVNNTRHRGPPKQDAKERLYQVTGLEDKQQKKPQQEEIKETNARDRYHYSNYSSHANGNKMAESSHNSRELPYSLDEREKQRNKTDSYKKKDSEIFLDKLTQARNEMKNLRQSVRGLQSQHKADVHHLENILEYKSSKNMSAEGNCAENNPTKVDKKTPRHDPIFENWKPIGFMESAYIHKNGTPRQGCLVKESRGRIRVLDAIYNNPQHSLEGLEQYSHVWITFVFDQNTSGSDAEGNSNTHTKAKVAPPRLGGAKLGVFATRSPHRPNPIGLTLAKLDSVEGSTVHVSGIDILYGTPILDIKPYIPQYDAPTPERSTTPLTRKTLMNQLKDETKEIHDSDEFSHSKLINGSADLNGSYFSMSINKSRKDETNNTLTKTPQPVNGLSGKNASTPQSKGIEITKVSTSNYDHLLAKVADMNTVDCSEEDNSSDSKKQMETNANSKGVDKTKLSTSEQLKNAEELAENDLLQLSQGADGDGVRTADWLTAADSNKLDVIFNPIAERQLQTFSPSAKDPSYRLEYCHNSSELRGVIVSGVQSDPRSSYRRQRCADLLHHYTADTAKVTCVFLDDGCVEILRVSPAGAGKH